MHINNPPPPVGDDTRGWGPPFVKNESSYFLSVNRNKKSITIDMKNEEGRKVVQRLLEKSDVVLENFVPGKLSSMGLGYNDMSLLNGNQIRLSNKQSLAYLLNTKTK